MRMLLEKKVCRMIIVRLFAFVVTKAVVYNILFLILKLETKELKEVSAM